MTPEQCQLLQDRLVAAERAYHDLMTGKSVRVLVDQNGERVEFTLANHFRLSTYIQLLKNQLANECGIGKPVMSGPMRFLFP